MLPFMFATGIENSAPTIANGRVRRDQMEECGHYRQWQTDLGLVAQLGIHTLRYGVPLHRTWLGPGRYDWEFTDQAFGELRPLGPVQREFVLDNGMTQDECRFFEDHALRGHCILGSDYYVTNEHHVAPDGASSDAGETLGYAMIAREYAERYGLPMMHTETNRDQREHGGEACDWLRRQFAVVRSLMRSGVQVVGFTWYSLTDQVDWHIELREACGVVNPRGLFDLQRRIRPVGVAYRDLIAAWDGPIGTVGAGAST